MSSMVFEVSTAAENRVARPTSAWHYCKSCSLPPQRFKSDHEFMQHLRDQHCVREGGSFVCKYGRNNFCSSLPIEGVNEKDYVEHVIRKHAWPDDSSVKSIGSATMQTSQKVEPGDNKEDPRRHSHLTGAVSAEHKWSVYDSSQNLAAVLNDPRRSTREVDFFTKTWDESFVFKTVVAPAPHLLEVSPRFFDRYLKKILKRNRRLKLKQASQGHAEGLARSLPLLLDKSYPDLESVPKVFLHPSFNLEDPETFNTVLHPSQLVVQSSERNSQPTAKLLQEKLSHYLDAVEVQIARQISLKSEAFFQAMTSHDALMDQLAFNIKAVSLLRKKIMRIVSAQKQSTFEPGYHPLHDDTAEMSPNASQDIIGDVPWPSDNGNKVAFEKLLKSCKNLDGLFHAWNDVLTGKREDLSALLPSKVKRSKLNCVRNNLTKLRIHKTKQNLKTTIKKISKYIFKQ